MVLFDEAITPDAPGDVVTGMSYDCKMFVKRLPGITAIFYMDVRIGIEIGIEIEIEIGIEIEIERIGRGLRTPPVSPCTPLATLWLATRFVTIGGAGYPRRPARIRGLAVSEIPRHRIGRNLLSEYIRPRSRSSLKEIGAYSVSDRG